MNFHGNKNKQTKICQHKDFTKFTIIFYKKISFSRFKLTRAKVFQAVKSINTMYGNIMNQNYDSDMSIADTFHKYLQEQVRHRNRSKSTDVF